MSLQPHVGRLLIYPIKSLDGVEIQQGTILPGGALQNDRELALVDETGRFVNGKRTAQVHRLRSTFDLENRQLALRIQNSDSVAHFHLDLDRLALEQWFSEYFGFPVHLIQNLDRGFPDDTASPGPTVISTATLEAIATWYPQLEVEELRRRFRTNIEISGVPPFWEDQLFLDAHQRPEEGLPFQIGAVQMRGINPCQRCVVVTRDSQTGEKLPEFQSLFVQNRRETLPPWAARSRFNHFYRLALNTRVPASEAGKRIAVGDIVQLSPNSSN
jgi:uncharacterized protein YcbX